MIAESGLRDRAALVRAMLLLSGVGFLVVLCVGIPVAGLVFGFPVRLEFYVALFFFMVGLAICFLVGRRRPPGTPLTWGEALVAAMFVFGIMLLGYGVVPNEWLKWADNQLLWRPDRIMAAISVKWPFIHVGAGAAQKAAAGRGRIVITYQAVRDIVAATIYIVMLGLQVALWVVYQKRGRRPAPAAEVERTSTFGRPVVRRA